MTVGVGNAVHLRSEHSAIGNMDGSDDHEPLFNEYRQKRPVVFYLFEADASQLFLFRAVHLRWPLMLVVQRFVKVSAV